MIIGTLDVEIWMQIRKNLGNLRKRISEKSFTKLKNLFTIYDQLVNQRAIIKNNVKMISRGMREKLIKRRVCSKISQDWNFIYKAL